MSNRLEVWKNIVETQKHFNGLIITIRERAITVLGAGLVAAAFLAKDNYTLKQPIRLSHVVLVVLMVLMFIAFYWIHFLINRLINIFRNANNKKSYNKKPVNIFWVVILSSVLSIIIYLYAKNINYIENSIFSKEILKNPGLAGLTTIALSFVWLVFYVMDRFWYHRLLKASVDANIRIETDLMNEITPQATPNQSIVVPYPGMGALISANSPVKPWGIPLELNSDAKIDFFYSSIFVVLFVIGVLLLKSSEIFQQQISLDKDRQIILYKQRRYDDSLSIDKMKAKILELKK